MEGKAFYVHRDIITLHSKPLERLINGEMRESQQGQATLDGVDAATFGRFLEWFYQGHYTPPELSKDPDTSATESPRCAGSSDDSKTNVAVQNYQDRLRNFLNRANDPPTASPLLEIQEDFTVRKYTELGRSDPLPAPRPNHKQASYATIFLCHARLYVFADERDVQRLKKLALENLHAALLVADHRKERLLDVVILLRYVYTHTAVSTEQQPEALRLLMHHYITFALDELLKSKHFRILMIEDGGPLLEDFMTVVRKRQQKMTISPRTADTAGFRVDMPPTQHLAPHEYVQAFIEARGYGGRQPNPSTLDNRIP